MIDILDTDWFFKTTTREEQKYLWNYINDTDYPNDVVKPILRFTCKIQVTSYINDVWEVYEHPNDSWEIRSKLHKNTFCFVTGVLSCLQERVCLRFKPFGKIKRFVIEI